MKNLSDYAPPNITNSTKTQNQAASVTHPHISIIDKIHIEIYHVLRTARSPSVLATLHFLATLYKLQQQRVYRNKRSLFYDSVTIFKSQAMIDMLITRYTRKFSCTMADIYIKASLKGIFHGDIVFHYKDGSIQACRGKNMIPDMDEVKCVDNSCKKVLVVEKDSVFRSMIDAPLIVVCGKGYPCHNTIKLLQEFDENTEIFCMTDFDPYGIDIFCTYKKRVSQIKRMGIRTHDLFEYKIKETEIIELNKHDYKKINSLSKKIADMEEEEEIKYDLEFMEASGFKVELEAIVGNESFDVIKYLVENKTFDK